jgi:AAA domain
VLTRSATPASPSAAADNAVPKRTNNVTALIIPSAHRTLAGAASQNRLKVFGLQAEELFAYVRRGAVDRADVVDALQAMAEENGIVDLYGQDHVQSIMAAAAADPGAGASSSPGKNKTGGWRGDLIDPRRLYDEHFPDLHYVVEGIFAEGVTLLASRPKLGKSWLLLQLGHAIAKGVTTLVATDNPAVGDVLYLALEDSPRRLKRRLQKFCGADKKAWPQRLNLVTKWRRMDEGGLDDLREWCRSVEKPALILVDVLKMVRAPRGHKQNDYDADYESCRGLKELASEFPGLAVVVAHHDRKADGESVFDTVSGTLGLTGGVDAIAIMKRKAGTVTLHVEGRDLPDDVEKAIRFDRETCRWTILGDATEVQRSSERQRILTVLASAPNGMGVAEILVAASLVSRAAADKLLFHMLRDGDVTKIRRGVYSLPSIAMSGATGKIGKKVRSDVNTLKKQQDKPRSPDLTDLTASPQFSPSVATSGPPVSEGAESAAKARKKAKWKATLAERTSGMTETARAEVYAADAAADAAEVAYKAINREADTRFGEAYRGGVYLLTGETFAERLASAKYKHAVRVVNALLNDKKPPKWKFDPEVEKAVAEAEQQRAADMSAYFAEHPQGTIADFEAAIEDREQARLNAEELEQARRSANLWDEREAALKAELPWSPPSGNDDIKWIREQYPEAG